MRLLVSALLVATCFVACSHAYPAFDSSDESDEKSTGTILVLPGSGLSLFGNPRIPGGVESVPSFAEDNSDESSWYSPSNLYLNHLQQSLAQMMKRLRDQIASISQSSLSFPLPWGGIPDGANTTSTTKIIDGHVVTINETVYSDGNNSEGTYIRVRVIDVKPQNETTNKPEADDETETTTLSEMTTPQRSVETVEEFDNEIPTNKNREDTLNA